MIKLNKAYEERATAQLRKLMEDPRYWKHQDSAYVEMVRQGFKDLYDNPPPEALAAEGKVANEMGLNGQHHAQDSMVAHVTPGEIVIPLSAQTPELMQHLSQTLGEDMMKFIVGSGYEQENPTSGLPAFADDGGWYEDATRWHYEDRDAKNVYLPENVNDARKFGSRWEEYPANQNKYHDNGRGKPERKFVNPDGREAVYDGDTGKLVTDPKLRGTYNYANAPRWGTGNMNQVGRFIRKGSEHMVKDVVPYWFLGNDR